METVLYRGEGNTVPERSSSAGFWNLSRMRHPSCAVILLLDCRRTSSDVIVLLSMLNPRCSMGTARTGGWWMPELSTLPRVWTGLGGGIATDAEIGRCFAAAPVEGIFIEPLGRRSCWSPASSAKLGRCLRPGMGGAWSDAVVGERGRISMEKSQCNESTCLFKSCRTNSEKEIHVSENLPLK